MRFGNNYANNHRKVLIIELGDASNMLPTLLNLISWNIRRIEYTETNGSIFKEFKLIS
jgi:hypothetical protein